MSKKSWILTDTAAGVHQDEFRISAVDMQSAGKGWSVSQRTLRGGKQDGVDLIEVDTGSMKLSILPTRGMGVWRAELPSGEMLGWQSPVHGPVHPKFVPVDEPSGLGWLDGFDELMVRCGLQSNGEPVFDDQGRVTYPLHGHIGNLPAQKVEVIVDDSAGTITVRGVVEESRFHFHKLRLTASIVTKIGSTSFTLDDEVENYGGTPTGIQMLYHINFGEPMVGEGAQVVAPVREVAPNAPLDSAAIEAWNAYAAPKAGFVEEVFFLDLIGDDQGQTQVMIKNAAGTSGAAMSLNLNQLPCYTVWKNMVASADGYVTGLEPATNLPNAKPFEESQGRVVNLEAGEAWSAKVTVDWLTNAEEVATTEQAVRALQGDTSVNVQTGPVAKWSPLS